MGTIVARCGGRRAATCRAVKPAVGRAEHPHLAGAPGLAGDPLHRLRPVLLLAGRVLVRGHPLAAPRAPAVQAGPDVAVPGQGEVRPAVGRDVVLAVGEVLQEHREGPGRPSRRRPGRAGRGPGAPRPRRAARTFLTQRTPSRGAAPPAVRILLSGSLLKSIPVRVQNPVCGLLLQSMRWRGGRAGRPRSTLCRGHLRWGPPPGGRGAGPRPLPVLAQGDAGLAGLAGEPTECNRGRAWAWPAPGRWSEVLRSSGEGGAAAPGGLPLRAVVPQLLGAICRVETPGRGR